MPLEKEARIPLKEAVKYVPERVHYQTLRMWSRRGVGGVKLEVLQVGRRFYTSVAAINRFLAALNGVKEAA